MRNFLTVLKFEYTGYIRPKSFKIMTALLAVVMLAAAALPAILGLFGRGGGASGDGAMINMDDLATAAFYDATGWYTPETIAAFDPMHAWQAVQSPAHLSAGVESEEFSLALHITRDQVTVYLPGSDSMWASPHVYFEMARAVAQAAYLEEAGVSPDVTLSVLSIAPHLDVVTIGRDGMQGYWITLAMTILLFAAISMFGSMVSASVSTEKTSKAVELLTISTSPHALMFGKVFAAGLMGVTQIALIIAPALVVLWLQLDAWHTFSPMVGMIVASLFGSSVLPLSFLFFLLGFFTFAFVFAALASTVGRAEDLASVQAIPTLLLMAAYYVSFSNMFVPEALHVRILSFVPFFSPLIMMSRVGMSDVPLWELLASVGASVLYILLLGLLSAKIYRIGVMLTGNRPSIRKIFRMLRHS